LQEGYRRVCDRQHVLCHREYRSGGGPFTSTTGVPSW
jgi:hypothetical protein